MSDENPPLPGAADAPHLTPTPHAVVRPVFEAEALDGEAWHPDDLAALPSAADELAALRGNLASLAQILRGKAVCERDNVASGNPWSEGRYTGMFLAHTEAADAIELLLKNGER